MNSNTLSMNVSHSTGVSLAGGMITSALMPFESLSGPSMSLERELRVAKRGGGFSHSAAAAAKSSYTSSAATRFSGAHGSSPAALFTFSPSPISADLPAPTR